MQDGARQTMWTSQKKQTGTVIDVDMTASTGLYIKFLVRSAQVYDAEGTMPIYVDWGDGAKQTIPYTSSDSTEAAHTYSAYGQYRIVFEHISKASFRNLDGQNSSLSYNNAILSYVDYSGEATNMPSGMFQNSTRLTRFVAPSVQWCGQRSFSNCSALEEVVIGRAVIHYDGTYQNCVNLTSFTAQAVGQCWHYIWQGCSSLRELHIEDDWAYWKQTEDPNIDANSLKLGNNVFGNCSNLMDIYIPHKTIAQISTTATGNIRNGSYAFPWGASSSCRFHGSDGVVLGNGTTV